MRRRDFTRAFCWLCIFVVFAAATASRSSQAQQNQADGVPRSELCGTTPEEFWSRNNRIPDERKWECYCFANPDAACHGSVSQKPPAKPESGSASQKPPVKAESVRKIAADAIFTTNLILNGDAEEGPGSPSGERVEIVLGWTTTGNFTVAQYGPEGADVKPDDPGPVDRGKNFFAGGPANADSSAAQVIDVSAAAAAIDRGEVVFNLAGYLGGWAQQNDHATLTATFQDMNGNLLGKTVLGPVTAADRRSNGGPKTGLLPKSQAGMVPKGTRIITFELRMTREVGSYNDGYADNLSFRLERLGILQALLQGTRIGLDSDNPSAMPGQPIAVRVKLITSNNIPVFAERDVPVVFEVDGDARVSSGQLTIVKGTSSVPAEIKSSTCGPVNARASSPGHGEDRGRFSYCCEGEVQQLQFDRAEERAMADGVTPLSFTIQLINSSGTPVANRAEGKSIGIERRGVGKVVPSGTSGEAGVVPIGQCAKRYSISSTEAGVATVTASMGNLSSPLRTFVFVLPLSIPLILLVMAGGIVGAFVQASLTWSRSMRWTILRWGVFLASGAFIGLCLFLAVYYGIAPALAERVPGLAFGPGFGFFLGMVGGYLGQAAMDRIAAQVVPLAKGKRS